MHEWTEEIKFDLVRTLRSTANREPGLVWQGPVLLCFRVHEGRCLAGSSVPRQPTTTAAAAAAGDTKRQCLSLQDKHRRQFSPADKISEQPAGAIGARVSRREPFVPGGS